MPPSDPIPRDPRGRDSPARDPIRRLLARDFLPFAQGVTQGMTQGIDVQSLWKWVKLSVLVGALTGLLASLVYFLLEWSRAMLFTHLAGFEQPLFGASVHLFDYALGPRLWWLIVLLPAAGGLAAGLFLYAYDRRSASGGLDQGGSNQVQGTNGLIDAFHERRGDVSPFQALRGVVATVFTLGSGGSAGPEGPVAYMGSSFGSAVARRFKLSARDRRLLLLAGAAGGISALFRTPLGAALFALEIIYKEDFESEGMFPVIVSSVTAYSVFTSIHHSGSLFTVPAEGYTFLPTQLVFYAVMAVAVAPFAVLWCKTRARLGPGLFANIPLPVWARPALGGLLLGALALYLPWVIGTGHGWSVEPRHADHQPPEWQGARPQRLQGPAGQRRVARRATRALLDARGHRRRNGLSGLPPDADGAALRVGSGRARRRGSPVVVAVRARAHRAGLRRGHRDCDRRCRVQHAALPVQDAVGVRVRARLQQHDRVPCVLPRRSDTRLLVSAIGVGRRHPFFATNRTDVRLVTERRSPDGERGRARRS